MLKKSGLVVLIFIVLGASAAWARGLLVERSDRIAERAALQHQIDQAKERQELAISRIIARRQVIEHAEREVEKLDWRIAGIEVAIRAQRDDITTPTIIEGLGD